MRERRRRKRRRRRINRRGGREKKIKSKMRERRRRRRRRRRINRRRGRENVYAKFNLNRLFHFVKYRHICDRLCINHPSPAKCKFWVRPKITA